MIKSGKSQSMQEKRKKATIEESRADIAKLEAEIQTLQVVFDDMVSEIEAKLQKRIKQVSDGDKIYPFADLEAANLASEQKSKALEARLEVA